jgi:hypothetical protein
MPTLIHVAVDWPSYAFIEQSYRGCVWQTKGLESLQAKDSCHKWWRYYLRSFRQQFPTDKMLVAVHTDADPRTLWLLKDYGVETVVSGARDHGAALNAVAAAAKAREIELMVHVEPDCLFNGRQWLDTLLAPLLSGEADMTGNFFCGYIHPTISAWRVAAIPDCGFSRQSRKPSQWGEPLMGQLCHKIGELCLQTLQAFPEAPREETMEALESIWLFWDTGGAAWFDLAIKGRAKLTPTPDIWHGGDFVHFWCGREVPPEERRETYHEIAWINEQLSVPLDEMP